MNPNSQTLVGQKYFSLTLALAGFSLFFCAPAWAQSLVITKEFSDALVRAAAAAKRTAPEPVNCCERSNTEAGSISGNAEKLPGVRQGETSDEAIAAGDANSQSNGQNHGVQWKSLYRQSLLFLAIEHGFRVGTQSDTRASLKGPFFNDYVRSVKGLRGWSDGDPFLTNYIGHGMMGAATGFMWLHNNPRSFDPNLKLNRSYFKHRLRAMAFSAVYSTQFELGPISEASIGNVGIKPGKASHHPMAYTDLVVTPAFGTAWIIGEDTLDKYLIRLIERKTSNRFIRIIARSWVNPSRSFANMLRGKWFWYRDDRNL